MERGTSFLSAKYRQVLPKPIAVQERPFLRFCRRVGTTKESRELPLATGRFTIHFKGGNGGTLLGSPSRLLRKWNENWKMALLPLGDLTLDHLGFFHLAVD